MNALHKKTPRALSLGLALCGFIILATLSPFGKAQTTYQGKHKEWRVVVARDVYVDYQHFIGKRDPLALRHFDGLYSRRDVVELVLLQQALARGGAQRPLNFYLTESESRTIKILTSESADITGTSTWQNHAEVQPDVLLNSRPLIRRGHFMAGLYFLEQHPAFKTLQHHPQDIRRYTAVCSSSWLQDLATLKVLGSPILLTENWSSMLGMLKKGRADYLLAPFQPTPGLRLKAGGVVLTPLPGVRVGLIGSRHFLMRKKGPEASLLARTMERGLQALEKDGVIERAYRESGFNSTQTQDWLVLNP